MRSTIASFDAPEDSGVFFTACDFQVPNSQSEGFWDLAKSAKSTLTSGQAPEGVRAVLDAVGQIVKSHDGHKDAAERGGALFKFDLHLSNLGVVSIELSYGDLSLRAL